MGRPWRRYVGLTLPQRILLRLDVRQASAHVASPCWVWTGSVTANGYGQIKFAGRVHHVHRAVWAALRGPVPRGRELDHLCRVPACCRPDHLEPVTHQTNLARAYA